jgi:uncharacterized protein YndB with AHSA1/START domain
MPEAQRTLTIAAPIEKVFAFFADPANDPSWRSGVKDIHAHGEPEVGAVVHQTIAGPMGRGIAADIEITDYDAPTKYGFRAIAGPVRPVGNYAFTSVDGGTEVAFSLTAEVTGFKKLMMGGPVQKSMDGEMAALDKAKAILEG